MSPLLLLAGVAEAAPLSLSVAHSSLVGGVPNRLTVTGVVPGRTVYVDVSETPAGPLVCPAVISPTCLTIRSASPVTVGSAIADASGVATVDYTPSDPVGVSFQSLQAYMPRPGGGRISNRVVAATHDSTSDADADGLLAADEVALGTHPGDADTDGDGETDDVDACPIGPDACDQDGDGSVGADDCDDLDPDVFPGARDLVWDGVDQDCDGADQLAYVDRVDLAAAATYTGAAYNDRLQYLTFAGDLDGDGFDDLVLGASGVDNGAVVDAGRAWLAYGTGSPSGDTNVGTLPSFSGIRGNDLFTYYRGLASAGDLDGDGYDDLIAGVPFADGAASSDVGWAGVLYGSPVRESGASTLASFDFSFTTTTSGSDIGHGVTGLGDVDGDGLDDAAFARIDSGDGLVYLLFGSAVRPSGAQALPTARVVGESQDALGWEQGVAGADLDGDGLSDVIIGAGGPNGSFGGSHVHVLYGDPVRPGAVTAGTLATVSDAEAMVTYYFGELVRSAGDLDGDGYADVFLGDNDYWGAAPLSGQGWVLGGGTAWGGNVDLSVAAVATIEGVEYDGSFAYDACGAGDVSGDGGDDLAVTALAWDAPYLESGAVAVFHGPITGTVRVDQAETRIEGAGGYNFLGAGLAAGDFDGDGWNDLAVSSARAAQEHGRVYLVLGGGL